MSKRITAWSLVAVWDDGVEEVITDLPTYVVTEVDDFLTQYEEDQDDELTNVREDGDG